jgi:LmbE family N-acetylglucosaminyl deacetylase
MKKILVIAPHADDEIIGLGGTLVKHITQGDEVYVCIATRGVAPLFSDEFMEQLRVETLACHKLLGVKKTFFLEFPSVMLDSVPRYELNGAMMKVFNEVQPQIVYIPHFGDMQKDHALVSEAAMVCVRPKYSYKVVGVYAYETLSETESRFLSSVPYLKIQVKRTTLRRWKSSRSTILSTLQITQSLMTV